MFGKRKQSVEGDKVDQLARQVVSQAAATEAECEAAVSSPFLYARIRNGIEARLKPLPSEPTLLASSAILLAARWAIPAMVIIALAAAAAAKLGQTTATLTQPSATSSGSNDTYGFASSPTTPVTACSLSTSTGCKISIREVLALMAPDAAKENMR